MNQGNSQRRRYPSSSGFHWAVLAFLCGYLLLLLGLSYFYLIPAFRVLQEAEPEQRNRLAAFSALLLAVMLAVLVVGLLLTFRVRRYFVRDADSTGRDKSAKASRRESGGGQFR
jgi:hypothetical protein